MVSLCHVLFKFMLNWSSINVNLNLLMVNVLNLEANCKC